MTLAAQITADVTDVFLVNDDFATSITHYPAGDETAGATVLAIVDYDFMDEDSGGDGGGTELSNERGVRVRQTAKLEIPIGTTVTEERGKLKPSTWLISSVKWTTLRVLGKDDDMQLVVITRTDQKITRRTQLVP